MKVISEGRCLSNMLIVVQVKKAKKKKETGQLAEVGSEIRQLKKQRLLDQVSKFCTRVQKKLSSTNLARSRLSSEPDIVDSVLIWILVSTRIMNTVLWYEVFF